MDAATLFPFWTLGLGHAALVSAKAKEHATTCKKRGLAPRPCVPGSPRLRACLVASMTCAGASVQVQQPYLGAGLFVAAFATSTFLAPLEPVRPRGPGEWCKLHDEVLSLDPVSRERFDPASRAGLRSFLGATIAVALLALIVRVIGTSPRAPLLLLADALVLVPLWLTGTESRMSPDPRTVASSFFLRVRKDLLRRGVAVSVIGRRPLGRANVDEVRLLVHAFRGVVGQKGIEVAVSSAGSRRVLYPELLVRTVDGSAAALKLQSLRVYGRALPGRTADERVFPVRVAAHDPAESPKETCDMVAALAVALSERRSRASEGDSACADLGDRRSGDEPAESVARALTS